ncbi:flagellar hook-length control protein FliK [Dasania marina]|uniref:flagellar hook-length control protein FliK n=1 Tax=Dasania marina TaxID=471499 RepID=UPI0003647097|nr:flagellar hook-length control protein FliK [Dasania marina]
MDTASQLLLGQTRAATAAASDRAANSGVGAKTAAANASSAQSHSQPDNIDQPFAQHMANATQPATQAVSAVNKSSGTATPHFDFSQEALLAEADSGNGLQFAGELLPGLLPQSMAGWSVSGQQAGASEANNAAAGSQGLPVDLEQQIAWQTPAGINAQAGTVQGTLAAGSDALAPLSQQSAQAQGMVTIMDNFKQQRAGAGLADPQALAEQWLDPDALTTMSTQSKTSLGQFSGGQAIPGLGLAEGQLTGPGGGLNALNQGLQQSSGQNTEALLAANAAALSIAAEPDSAAADKLAASLLTATATSTTSYPKVDGGASYAQAASASFQTSVSTSVMAQGWGDTVMQRVMWMSSQQIHSAEIQLDPPELGSLMVKINTSQEQTTVNFISPHAAVRDALDQNLPKLRELMAEQGVDMVDVDVSEHPGHDKAEQGDDGGEGAQAGLLAQQGDEAMTNDQPGTQPQLQDIGLINAYV